MLIFIISSFFFLLTLYFLSSIVERKKSFLSFKLITGSNLSNIISFFFFSHNISRRVIWFKDLFFCIPIAFLFLYNQMKMYSAAFFFKPYQTIHVDIKVYICQVKKGSSTTIEITAWWISQFLLYIQFWSFPRRVLYIGRYFFPIPLSYNISIIHISEIPISFNFIWNSSSSSSSSRRAASTNIPDPLSPLVFRGTYRILT